MRQLTANDVISEDVITVDQSLTIKEASKKLKNSGIRGLVVVNDSEVVGIIVGRDIVYDVIAEGKKPSETKVKEVMTEDIVVGSVGDDVEEMAKVMSENDISRLPVFKGDSLVGIVTESDVMRAWPSYVSLIEEEKNLQEPSSILDRQKKGSERKFSGTCDDCENFSEQLVVRNGKLLCPDCR